VTTFIDIEVLADTGNDFVVLVDKTVLNQLSQVPGFELRHWDGERPVSLVAYGKESVRTLGDDSEVNNLSELPRVKESDLKNMLK